jgi:N-acetylmuramoyl-L-alanine amidase
VIRSHLAHDFVLSPNIEPRRNGRTVDMLVLHYTGMESALAARDWLCHPQSGVSCHYLIDEGGRITQMVGEEMRAWHAGVSLWRGEDDTNSRSIGIEIHNSGHFLGYCDFPGIQMESVILLCRDILSRHDIPARNVLAHSDVAPGRKIDPGERFDWGLLHGAGIGHWVVPESPGAAVAVAPDEIADMQRLLAAYGYGISDTGIQDEVTVKAVNAFQRHFRTARVDGVADRSTLLTLRRLVGSLPD